MLLGYLAWCMEPLGCKQLTFLLEKAGVKPREIKSLIDELSQSQKMIAIDKGKGHETSYRLSVESHLEWLWKLKEASPETLQLYQSLRYYSRWVDVLAGWRQLILTYALSGDVNEYPCVIDSGDIILNLWKGMFLDSRWEKLCQSVPDETMFYFFRRIETLYADRLEKPDAECIRRAFLENERIPAQEQAVYRDIFSLFQYVLSGRINDIPQGLPQEGVFSLCGNALYYQYQGRCKEAITLYQKALRQMGETFFRYPLYNVMYVLALMNDGDASSKKKLGVLSKKKELHQVESLLPARLLIYFSQHEDMDEMRRQVEARHNSFAPLLKVLVALLVRHFHLWENSTIDMVAVAKLVDQDHLKLFQLEYSQDFPLFMDKAEELKRELGLTPLLPPYKKLTEWEKALSVLMDVTAGKLGAASGEVKPESRSRIVYYVDQSEQITPRLQKSKDGVTWSKGRNIALTTFKQQAVEEMNETDRRLSACVRNYSGGWSIADYSELGGPTAFAALAGYPLVFQTENPDVPVVITKEEPQIVMTKALGGYRVSVNVAPPYETATLVKKENDQLFRVITLNPTQRKVMETFHRISYFPITAKAQLAELLSRLSQSITIHSDLLQSDEKLKTVKGDTLVTVQLQPMGDGVKVELFVKPFIEQPPYCKAGEGAGSVIGVVGSKRVQAVRNLKAEKENFELISRLLKRVSGDRTATDVLFFDDYYQCLELIDALREQTKVARTEWPEGVKFSINHSADFPQLNLSLKGVGQWFEVDGELKVDARTKLKISELLQKVRQSKGRFIALGDSEFLALSQQLRRQLEEIDAMLMHDKKTLQISRLNTSAMAEMEQLGVQLNKDKAFTDLQHRMEQAEKEKYTLPKNLQAELRGYQEDGFRWMSRLAHWGAGACLADDMGLGKTIQAIALMLSRGKRGASLVIAPASVLLNWKSEIERFAPSLTATVMHDADGGRKQLVDDAVGFEVVLTTYGLLIKEAELLASKSWNVIILDEAHTIKNKETKMSKAAMELNGEFRLLLTGTPLQNHLGEIWNLFQFANPGLLGSFQHFNESFIQPIEKGEDKQRQKQLKKILQPFLLRRTKTQVLDELPEKTEITLPVELSEEERALYENLREQAMLNLEENSSNAMQALAEITRLRQAACHPALVNKELTLASAKTQAFLKLTDELITNNHRALVFSQFTSHLALIRKELDERSIDYLYLDGGVSVNERAALVKQFHSGEQPLFLISLKAGGTGLNLTAADYVIHLDPWWNPAVEDQASDRAHRIGQTRPVTIYRLIAMQTIEEKIIKLHQTKKSLADSLLDGSDMAHKLTKEEMLELLRGADY